MEVTIVKRETFTGKPLWGRCSVTQECVKKKNSVKTEDCVPSLTVTQTQVNIPVPEDLVTFTDCPVMTATYELKVWNYFIKLIDIFYTSG